MTHPQVVATAWTSAGNTSPMRTPATSPVPIAERVAAVADAGYVGLGLIADDLLAIRNTIGFAALRDMIADHGLTHVEIELIERWWIPRGEPGNSYDVRELLFDAADVLAPAFVKIGSQNGPAIADPLPLVGPLRELADQAAAHGTRVAIEPATSFDELRAALTPGMIFGVELNDAAPDIVGTLSEDTVDNRLVCGDGCFDLRGLVSLLRDKGFDGPWGVEILSSSFRRLPVAEAVKLAADSALMVLCSVRHLGPGAVGAHRLDERISDQRSA
jgi:sugar phosphate isomerase/epimerase